MTSDPSPTPSDAAPESSLDQGTYEIIRQRLEREAGVLSERLHQLNEARRQVFGSIETKLLATERITTANNCVPRDIVAIGQRFIFGYNVHIGLKSETALEDVFAIQRFDGTAFHADTLEDLADPIFLADFKQLYKYYKKTSFVKFWQRGPHLYMAFQIGKGPSDIKAFKWLIQGSSLKYLDARSEHELKFPPQHEFEWKRTHRDLHRSGAHPHISIEDRLFVETIGGDLTIKVEDNTDLGDGIYSEGVDNPDQTLDDAEIFYSIVGSLILLKIRPYQEQTFRYLVYSEKVNRVTRIDAIEHACVLLPEGHGLIFSRGYCLQNGDLKTFDSGIDQLKFERRIAAPNGEDFLYVFYRAETGTFVLLSYNVIEQQVQTPLICHGFSLFDNGQLLFFRAAEEPQKHHAVQIWQTPFVGAEYVPHTETSSYLYKVGNPDIVRGMAECHEIVNLARRDDSYQNLYWDLTQKAGDILDSYFWLKQPDTFRLDVPLQEIRSTASAAIDEYEKVRRIRQNTTEQYRNVVTTAEKLKTHLRSRRFSDIHDFVAGLGELRQCRGQIIGLRDLRYVDLASVDSLEGQIAAETERLSHQSIEFLLQDDSLVPYANQVDQHAALVPQLTKGNDAKRLEQEIAKTASELELLVDVVSNLKIDDATQRTQIVDRISDIYSRLNQTRAGLKKQARLLFVQEGEAEFHSQLKLLAQAVANYLDVCDTPEKCDDYLTKLMVQVQELEGRFAEFDPFVLQLAEKRDEIYSAFDAKKLALVETRNKRATALMTAAERILQGIASRVRGLTTVNDIHSYFAADLMVEKIRDLVSQLTRLDESVKVDDIQSRLKTIREDAVRQLKDRQELFVGGENVIQLGRHRFSVNVQPLDLTTVVQGQCMYFHLTGTNFMEPVTDAEVERSAEFWQQEIVSENGTVYRGEFLAYRMLEAIDRGELDETRFDRLSSAELADEVRQFMSSRHVEGYVKGVHDHDGAMLLCALLQLRREIGMLRYPSSARAWADFCWNYLRAEGANRQTIDWLCPQLEYYADIVKAFPDVSPADELKSHVVEWLKSCVRPGLFDESLVSHAADFLLVQTMHPGPFPVSEHAHALSTRFRTYLTTQGQETVDRFECSRHRHDTSASDRFYTVRNWLKAFVATQLHDSSTEEYLEETAALLLDPDLDARPVLTGTDRQALKGLLGEHPRLDSGEYSLAFREFHSRLHHYVNETVPRFEMWQKLKRDHVERKRKEMRLNEFKPRVLTSFVRNRLIDQVYLPLIGNNLAKQIGVVGEAKRTDLMGMLLLISPPGYGKTTLMEYVANRLGITFMKINGPALGHQVTSLDPMEAPNASAREEVEKLNLALEMGDNVMIYVDDIQHCDTEFLQKFISLCDGQRKMEGVYRGQPKTYDLRGRKVAVVMAGNPYTESGERFQIPDMLANRADTYNLGDVIGSHESEFQLSYLENALTSNPTLNGLAQRSQSDVYAVIRLAQGESDGITFEGTYSPVELTEFTTVMRKLIRVRDVLLRVNQAYIRSAAQADAYRTEPPFKLQGSYRDMNKIAERIVSVMNDQELEVLIQSHYENQAQTLTTGAESNLLKLKELLGTLSPDEQQRWDEIKRRFQRNLLLGGAAGEDRASQVVAQLSLFSEGLSEIKDALRSGVACLDANSNSGTMAEPIALGLQYLQTFSRQLESLQNSLTAHLAQPSPRQEVQVVYRVPKVFLDVIKTQFTIMETWLQPIIELARSNSTDAQLFRQTVDATLKRYEALLQRMESSAEE